MPAHTVATTARNIAQEDVGALLGSLGTTRTEARQLFKDAEARLALVDARTEEDMVWLPFADKRDQVRKHPATTATHARARTPPPTTAIRTCRCDHCLPRFPVVGPAAGACQRRWHASLSQR